MRRLIDYLPALGITLAWAMPLHFPPWVTWHSEAPVFGAVLLTGTWAVVRELRSQGSAATTSLPSMVIALLVIGGLTILQASTGVIRFYGDVWTVLLYVLLCAAAFLIGHAQAREPVAAEEATTALAGTLLLAGLGCTIIALVQALDVWESSEWIARTPTLRRSGANLSQPNQMATLLLMGAASLAYLFERGRLRARTAAFLGTLLALGLATTESRTGLIAVAALATWWFCRGYPSRLRPSIVVGSVVLVLLAYLAWPPLLEGFHGQAGAQAARVNTRVGLRAIVWPQLAEAVAQKPWVGWGARQTSTALTSVVHAYPVSEPYTYAHNILLESLLAYGVPVTVLAFGCAAVWVWRRWQARGNAEGWFCMALWVPLTVHALLEFPYAYAYLLAPAMFALGLLDGRSRVAEPRRIPMAWMAGALACAWVMSVWSVYDYVRVEEDFRVARFESGRIGVTPPEYDRPDLRFLTQLGAMVEAARIVPAPGMSPESMSLARDVAARFPWPALQNRYALALALNGQEAAAERELRVVLAMHGEQLFRDIRLNWKKLESDKYPQLSRLHMPEVPAQDASPE